MKELRSSVRPIVTLAVGGTVCLLALGSFWRYGVTPDWFIDLAKMVVGFWFVERAIRAVADR